VGGGKRRNDLDGPRFFVPLGGVYSVDGALVMAVDARVLMDMPETWRGERGGKERKEKKRREKEKGMCLL